MSQRRRPLITANMVTLARLVPMPLLSWWVYESSISGLKWALLLGIILGCTDFVDGYMARRQGPTVLGGLLDPIADKVFIAFLYFPFADGIAVMPIPAWTVALMFTRELLVTALRSAYEQRNLSMKTSYLGKMKTWFQMQGIGILVLFPIVAHEWGPDAMTWILGFGVVAPLIAMAGLWLVRHKFWPGALVMSGALAALLAVHRLAPAWTYDFVILVVVALTWVSGFDYLLVGMRQLRGRGDFGRADLVRLVGAVALPCLIFAVARLTPAPAWPLIALLSLELAVGGLDNLLSHHKKASGALAWGARTLGASALLAVALLVPSLSTWLCVVATAISFAGVTWEFWRGRDYYLDKRIRNEAIRGQGASALP